MPTVETAARWAHVVTVDYFSQDCTPPDKHSMQVFLAQAVEKRDAAIRAAEQARVVKRLREFAEAHAEEWRHDSDYWQILGCADLLEREGAGT